MFPPLHHLVAVALIGGFVLPAQITQSAKILSICFLTSPSHQIIYEPLLFKLAERGHEVTVVSPSKSKVDMKNMRNFQTLDPDEFEKEMAGKFPNLFEMRESKLANLMGGFFSPFMIFGEMMDTVCRRSYDVPIVKDILSGKEKFDLVLFTPLFNDCVYGLIHHLNVSTILISQVTVMPWVAASLGTPVVPSFTPFTFFGYDEKMSFSERMANFLGILSNELVKNVIFNPRMEKVYRDMIDPTLPSIKEIEANSSIVLANSHVSFTPPKPLMPDIIDVGGMHLKPSKPVQPKELDDFLNGGKDGFILFSMGSALKAHTMPEKYRKIFLNTFAKLKQRVIWKWETEKMDDLPPNVKLSKWLPQQDVLGHKNIKLFITHGGHGGTTEAIYHGVPLVGIPMVGDQQYNMKMATKKGFAFPVEYTELSEQVLTEAIEKVLNDPSFRRTAQKLSAIYRDQVDHPLDRAVYHVEYVIRHQGARHLRSAARDLTTIQYYSLDVMSAILAGMVLILYIDFIVLRALYRKCFEQKAGHLKSTKKTQ